MHVKDLMATNVVTIGRNDDLRLADDIMTEHRIRHIPVLEEDKIVGVITQRDVFKARMSSTMGYGEKGQRAFLHTVPVKEIMAHPVVTVTPETPVTEAVDLILTQGIGCLPGRSMMPVRRDGSRPLMWMESQPMSLAGSWPRSR